eukprot:m51a1_g967 hypothetical protein (322) ;mRNA; r:368850-369887
MNSVHFAVLASVLVLSGATHAAVTGIAVADGGWGAVVTGSTHLRPRFLIEGALDGKALPACTGSLALSDGTRRSVAVTVERSDADEGCSAQCDIDLAELPGPLLVEGSGGCDCTAVALACTDPSDGVGASGSWGLFTALRGLGNADHDDGAQGQQCARLCGQTAPSEARCGDGTVGEGEECDTSAFCHATQCVCAVGSVAAEGGTCAPETVYAALWLRDVNPAAVLDDTLVAEAARRMKVECLGEGDVVLVNVTRSASAQSFRVAVVSADHPRPGARVPLAALMDAWGCIENVFADMGAGSVELSVSTQPDGVYGFEKQQQ